MTDRNRLSNRRAAETFELKLNGTVFVITVGCYPSGEIAEVFVSGPKAGSELDAVARDSAVLLSIALQHGVPLDVIRHALTREGNGAPSTVIGAVVDRWCALMDRDVVTFDAS